MSGIDYVAVQRITDKAGAVLAAVGERCDRVPPASLGWLAEGGYIRHEPDHAPVRKPRERPRERE